MNRMEEYQAMLAQLEEIPAAAKALREAFEA